jgi:hypothetical protein
VWLRPQHKAGAQRGHQQEKQVPRVRVTRSAGAQAARCLGGGHSHEKLIAELT